jgi:undecaprenyl-diphosphatase
MVSFLEALLLSIVQGITEWLPISSSGHLAIVHSIFGFQSLPFDIFLHFASILAVIAVFWKDIIKLFDFKGKGNLRYLLLLLLALIPAGIAGMLFKSQIESFFSSYIYLGIFFMTSGIIVYATKFAVPRKDMPNWLDAIFIGIFQAFAILPGVSRSGATISSSMFSGLKKEAAVKFSFILAIPLILGATVIEVRELILENTDYLMLAASFIVTFLVSIFSIKILLKIIRSRRFYMFGLYNFAIGTIIFFWGLFG